MPRLFSYHFSLHLCFAIDDGQGWLALHHRFRRLRTRLPLSRSRGFCHALSALFSAGAMLSITGVPHLFTRKMPSRPGGNLQVFGSRFGPGHARNLVVAYGAPTISGSVALLTALERMWGWETRSPASRCLEPGRTQAVSSTPDPNRLCRSRISPDWSCRPPAA
jgi:hypothetical protein